MENQTPKRVILQPKDTRYLREQKAAFALVGVTGGLAILLGIFFLADHIKSPLDRSYVGPRLLSSAEQQQRDLEEQAVNDTDGDGLTDFVELYTHRTSPYLSDTDGDGLSDGLEISAGTNPNCAEGDDCSNEESTSPIVGGGIQDLADAELAPSTEVDLLIAQIENLTPTQIRELLVESGASETELAAIPDAQLISVYTSTLRELEQNGQLEAYLRTGEPVEAPATETIETTTSEPSETTPTESL